MLIRLSTAVCTLPAGPPSSNIGTVGSRAAHGHTDHIRDAGQHGRRLLGVAAIWRPGGSSRRLKCRL